MLALALPQSRKSGIWEFLCLDLVNINKYTKSYQSLPYGWRSSAISIFSPFCFGSVLVKEKWRLDLVSWLDLVGICQYAKIYQNIPNGLSAMAFFAYWHGRSDGHAMWLQGTLRKTVFQSVDFSAGRAVLKYREASYLIHMTNPNCHITTHLNRNVRQRTFVNVRPVRIQISLRVRADWSESSLGSFWIAKDAKFLRAYNEDSN